MIRRRLSVTVLLAVEALVLVGIVTCSLDLSRQVSRSAAVGQVTRAVVAGTRALALGLRSTVRMRAG